MVGLLVAMVASVAFAAPASAATQVHSSSGSAEIVHLPCLEDAVSVVHLCENGLGPVSTGERFPEPGASFATGTYSALLQELTTAPMETSSIGEVPAPVAVWLLLSGLGALGLCGKRRRDAFPSLRNGAEMEPLPSALRGSVSPEPEPVSPGAVSSFSAAAVHRLVHDMLMPGGRCSIAFAPDCADPVRSGGAENRYAIAEDRAPPQGRARDLVGRFLSASPRRAAERVFCSCRTVTAGLQLFFDAGPMGLHPTRRTGGPAFSFRGAHGAGSARPTNL